MSDDMDVVDVLDAAADYLRMNGWHQGSGFRDHFNGPACVMGATYAASPEDDRLGCGADSVLADSLGVGLRLATWNDAPERTADEVIDALMEAAARVRTGEIKP